MAASGDEAQPGWRRAMCRMQSEQRRRRMLPQGSIALFNFGDLAQEVLVRTCRPAKSKDDEEGPRAKQVTFRPDVSVPLTVKSKQHFHVLLKTTF